MKRRVPGREEERGKSGRGETACQAGSPGEQGKSHVPGAQDGEGRRAQADHKGLAGQAEELELLSATGREPREVPKQGKDGPG